MRFDRLAHADLDGALRLSTQAGWNQLPQDWTRMFDLAPEGCVAGRLGSRLVATASLATYEGRVGWVGMVLVDRAERGKGYGTELLARTIGLARELEIPSVGLDATDLGRPVYLKLGFVDVAPIDRWFGTLRPSAGRTPARALAREELEPVYLLDRGACGVERRGLIRHLAWQPGVKGWTVRGGRGYAFLRPGRQHSHLGPIVARDPAALDAILESAAREGGTLYVDALRVDWIARALEARGLRIQRRLTRMTLGRAEPLLMGSHVVAATAFEWG